MSKRTSVRLSHKLRKPASSGMSEATTPSPLTAGETSLRCRMWWRQCRAATPANYDGSSSLSRCTRTARAISACPAPSGPGFRLLVKKRAIGITISRSGAPGLPGAAAPAKCGLVEESQDPGAAFTSCRRRCAPVLMSTGRARARGPLLGYAGTQRHTPDYRPQDHTAASLACPPGPETGTVYSLCHDAPASHRQPCGGSVTGGRADDAWRSENGVAT